MSEDTAYTEKRKHTAGVWVCPRCNFPNAMWSTRIGFAKRVGLDCKGCQRRIQVYYEGKWGSNWLVKFYPAVPNIRGVAWEMAEAMKKVIS